MTDSNEDIISVQPEPIDPVNSSESSADTVAPDITQTEAPIERIPISEPYHKKPENYKHLDRTISVMGEPLSDKEIILIMKEREKELIEDNPGDKSVEQFLSLIESFQEILSTSYIDEEFAQRFKDVNSEFIQKISGDKGKAITVNSPIFSPSKTSNELEGLNAVRFLASVTGVGNVTRIPCWHSGIVITIDTFKERRLLDLHQTLVRQQMDLGTNTKGAIFSGDDIYTTMTIVEFILEHVIDSSLLNWDNKILKSVILVDDIPAIITGALASIYPRGYPVFHQCINTIRNTCNYTVNAEINPDTGDYLPDRLLDFRKVLWVDNKHLTIADKLFMSVNTPTHKLEDVKLYQKRVNNYNQYENGINVFENENVKVFMTFKIPTLEEYFTTSIEWCTRVIDMVDKTMLLDNTSDEKRRIENRNDILNQYASMVNILKQSHWIDYITIVDSEQIERKIVDLKTINASLEYLAAIDGFDNAFSSNLLKYKTDTIFAFTGIPNFECPNCHSGQVASDAKYPSIIPLNMVSYFFILMVWRNRTR